MSNKEKNIIECIKKRRSVRCYNEKKVENSLVSFLLEAAIWAPSGKNIQPWKFRVITEPEIIKQISKLMQSSRWLKNAPCLIFVFLDKSLVYEHTKDVLSCGAAIENILLSAYSVGLSTCWIGEILNHSNRISSMLNLPCDKYELISVISIGYNDNKIKNIERRALDDFII